jgi:hypothetical protein
MTLRIASLPVASIAAPLQQTAASKAALASATPTTELLVKVKDRPARSDYIQAIVSAQNVAFAQIRIGTWVGWGGGPFAADGGAFITCSAQYSTILPARWETLSITDEGAELTVTDGWFDQGTCKPSVVRRAKVTAAPLFAGGLVYAFPRAQNVVASALGGEARRELGSFSRVSLPIRRGGGGSMMARLPGTDIQSWKKAAGLKAEPPASAAQGPSKPAPAPVEIFFGVEVSQSIEDPEPFAIAYIGPEDALAMVASLGVGHPDVGLVVSDSPELGGDCACQPGDSLCSCF